MDAVHCNYVIHHFHIICTLFTPQNFAQPFSLISLGTTVLPGQIGKKMVMQNLGGKQVALWSM